jgi:glycosyltransferase involved in cell wall biosynthesis
MTPHENQSPLVSVITRTKNRAFFLHRCMTSLKRQKFKNFEWIIVNDGGEQDHIESIKEEFSTALPQAPVRIISHAICKGRPAAANTGFRAARGTYILLLDDDDLISDEFLLKTTSYLDKNTHSYGVKTYAKMIIESWDGKKAKKIKTRPYAYNFPSVNLADISVCCQITTCSFLFKKDIFNIIGYFNEDYLSQEDWDFYIRFISKKDIGVIQESLCGFTFRKTSIADARNSNDMHSYYDSVIRNRYLREDLEKGKAGLGFLLAQGWLLRETARVERLRLWLKSGGPLMHFRKRLRDLPKA